uniref:Uncharacterized protein n=1 Tax=Lysobacter sp. ATCC 53042 TaxID=324869 RepID=F8TUB1_9GAMM|nr:unknown [Lysobacter sp. ATCC 53042]
MSGDVATPDEAHRPRMRERARRRRTQAAFAPVAAHAAARVFEGDAHAPHRAGRQRQVQARGEVAGRGRQRAAQTQRAAEAVFVADLDPQPRGAVGARPHRGPAVADIAELQAGRQRRPRRLGGDQRRRGQRGQGAAERAQAQGAAGAQQETASGGVVVVHGDGSAWGNR